MKYFQLFRRDNTIKAARIDHIAKAIIYANREFKFIDDLLAFDHLINNKHQAVGFSFTYEEKHDFLFNNPSNNVNISNGRVNINLLSTERAVENDCSESLGIFLFKSETDNDWMIILSDSLEWAGLEAEPAFELETQNVPRAKHE